MNNILSVLGRVLISVIFILSAVTKVGNFNATVLYMEAHGMPMAPFFLYGAITLEFLGGLMVATGYKSKIGILMLLLFLVPATLVFHGKVGDQQQMVHFLKNLSIAGALLFMLGNGPGKLAAGKD